jgi:hypothetical protein
MADRWCSGAASASGTHEDGRRPGLGGAGGGRGACQLGARGEKAVALRERAGGVASRRVGRLRGRKNGEVAALCEGSTGDAGAR